MKLSNKIIENNSIPTGICQKEKDWLTPLPHAPPMKGSNNKSTESKDDKGSNNKNIIKESQLTSSNNKETVVKTTQKIPHIFSEGIPTKWVKWQAANANVIQQSNTTVSAEEQHQLNKLLSDRMAKSEYNNLYHW